MANWKLRKDKTPTGTPDVPSSSEPAPEQREEAQEPFLEAIPLQPAFEAEPEPNFADMNFADMNFAETDFSGLDFDADPEEPEAPAPSDGPLTLVDYTEPVTAEETEEEAHPAFSLHGAQIFEMPPPRTETPADSFERPADSFEMPAAIALSDAETVPAAADVPEAAETVPEAADDVPEAADDVPEAADDVPELLRTGRFEAGELAPAPEFGFGIPTVSPFVLDTPPPAPAAAPPPPQLVVRVGRLSAPFPLVKDVTTVGRPDSSLHYYPDVEIELDDAVSRRHAEVVRREDSYFLVDTGSTNGTLLNGEKLPAHEERLLAYGDRIKIGDRTEITLE